MIYPARHAYKINQGGREIVIGKVLDAPYGVVFYRAEPHDVAYMRNMSAFSIDERALPQWLADAVDYVHFADKGGLDVWTIPHDDFVLQGHVANNGAGRQVYVDVEHFRRETLDYEPGWTEQIKWLANPLTRWEPLTPPAPRRPRVPSNQGSLL